MTEICYEKDLPKPKEGHYWVLVKFIYDEIFEQVFPMWRLEKE